MSEIPNGGELIVRCARWHFNYNMTTLCKHAVPDVMSMGCQYANATTFPEVTCNSVTVYEELIAEAISDGRLKLYYAEAPAEPEPVVQTDPLADLGDLCRYSDNLLNVLRKLKAVEILRLEYLADYQGDLDIDVLLKDGRVFSYAYSYGSCSGCDDWESRHLTEAEIEEEMLIECSIFPDKDSYQLFRDRCAEIKKSKEDLNDRQKDRN